MYIFFEKKSSGKGNIFRCMTYDVRRKRNVELKIEIVELRNTHHTSYIIHITSYILHQPHSTRINLNSIPTSLKKSCQKY